VRNRFQEIAVKDSARPGWLASQSMDGPCRQNSKWAAGRIEARLVANAGSWSPKFEAKGLSSNVSGVNGSCWFHLPQSKAGQLRRVPFPF